MEEQGGNPYLYILIAVIYFAFQFIGARKKKNTPPTVPQEQMPEPDAEKKITRPYVAPPVVASEKAATAEADPDVMDEVNEEDDEEDDIFQRILRELKEQDAKQKRAESASPTAPTTPMPWLTTPARPSNQAPSSAPVSPMQDLPSMDTPNAKSAEVLSDTPVSWDFPNHTSRVAEDPKTETSSSLEISDGEIGSPTEETDESFNLKQAVIYHEILNRKY